MGGFAFSVAAASSVVAASSVAVVSLTTTGDPRTKQEFPQMILWRAWFLLAQAMN